MSVTDLLMAGRSGGQAVATNKVTGRTVVATVPVPEIETIVDKDTPHATVSAEIEWAPNLAYSKVSVRVWASTPCPVGSERAQIERIKAVLHEAVRSYVDDYGMPVLEGWAHSRG